MSFQKVIDRWRGENEHDLADRSEQALALFESKYPLFFSNLDTDPQITTAARRRLLEQVAAVDVNQESLVYDAVIRFCRGHRLRGRRQPTAEKAHLGHVEERTKFDDRLKSVAAHLLPTTRRRRAAMSVLDDLRGRTVDEQKALLKQTPLRESLTWSFYQSHHQRQPFHGVEKTKEGLINRLGLGEESPRDSFVLWTHQLRAGQPAHRPTAFDAEAYDYFRPGGKTIPLDGSNSGLREVVHGAIYADQLVERLEVLD